MMKNILLLLVFALISTPAFAGAKSVNHLSKYWGGRPFDVCISGNTGYNKELIINSGEQQAVSTEHRKGYGYKVMVALDVTDKGAYFCPMFVYGWGEWKGDTSTRYGRYGDDGECVWLCLPGWTGETCEESTNGGTVSSSCDFSKLEKANYNKFQGMSSAEIETSVAMFHMNSYNWCGYNTKMEYDMILMVTDFLPNGGGAFVDQVIVGTWRDGEWRHEQKHHVKFNTDKNPVLVCKNGYAPNAAGDDCVEINSAVCNVAKCEQVANGFNADIHQVTMYQEEKKDDKGETVVSASCIFKCAEPGYAFESETSKNCVECPRELRQGESAETGICLKCAENQIFDSVAGACVEGMQLQSTDLMYGLNKSSSATDESEPCWMKSKTEEYINCILSQQQ